MLHHHVVEVSMESTSVYWIPIWRVLSPHFKLNLANPYFIKQIPGRKSDVKDAQWIAECTIKERAATSLIAEIGTDMNKFETANHLASWSGLKPRNDESNKKIKSRSITHGNVYYEAEPPCRPAGVGVCSIIHSFCTTQPLEPLRPLEPLYIVHSYSE